MGIFDFFTKKEKMTITSTKTNTVTDEEIKKVLDPHKRKAWYPVVKEEKGGRDTSKFSGSPVLLDSEEWPCCGNCKEPMQLFTQLNSNELPQDANKPFGEGYLQVFYCTNSEKECEIETEAYFPFSKSTLVRVLGFDEAFSKINKPSQVKEELPEKVITGWEPQNDYPSGEELDELGVSFTDEQFDYAYEKNYMSLSNDKLLGWPLWVQGVEYPDCPECGERMNYIFQIDSDDNLDYMFGDAGCSHITQCKKHRDKLAIAWACG
ncbi:DUF1963 domain-containing protein [uncultured Cocleimonas sp.]|uniref:DUF1963 domain-containing protein n=1 Tax=uncultured Cocleimonas sp. TaxID=1051587 RepID=UPI002620F151|nr:DUF1963 domain-containing protein [uncultured Cocleimonas sp.]